MGLTGFTTLVFATAAGLVEVELELVFVAALELLFSRAGVTGVVAVVEF